MTKFIIIILYNINILIIMENFQRAKEYKGSESKSFQNIDWILDMMASQHIPFQQPIQQNKNECKINIKNDLQENYGKFYTLNACPLFTFLCDVSFNSLLHIKELGRSKAFRKKLLQKRKHQATGKNQLQNSKGRPPKKSIADSAITSNEIKGKWISH